MEGQQSRFYIWVSKGLLTVCTHSWSYVSVQKSLKATCRRWRSKPWELSLLRVSADGYPMHTRVKVPPIGSRLWQHWSWGTSRCLSFCCMWQSATLLCARSGFRSPRKHQVFKNVSWTLSIFWGMVYSSSSVLFSHFLQLIPSLLTARCQSWNHPSSLSLAPP